VAPDEGEAAACFFVVMLDTVDTYCGHVILLLQSINIDPVSGKIFFMAHASPQIANFLLHYLPIPRYLSPINL